MKLDILPENSRSLRAEAIASSLLLAPFFILESVTSRGFARGFPAALFIFMWVLGLSFVSILNSLAASGRPASNLLFVLKGGALILIGWMWVTLVIDQMPCFLGVPNCD